MKEYTEIEIFYRDTDCGGVVYYANYLSYFEIGRTKYMEKKGQEVQELARKGNLFIVREASLEYLSPAVYGDIIIVETVLSGFSRIALEFSYLITRKKDGIKLVIGKTKLISVNSALKPVRISEELMRLMEKDE